MSSTLGAWKASIALGLLGLAGLIGYRLSATQRSPKGSVSLERIATLISTNPEALSAKPRFILRDPRGRFLLSAGSWVNPRISVFDSSGAFLRFLAPLGNGPGRFRIPTGAFLSHGDTLYVLTSRTIALFDPDLEFVRSIVPHTPIMMEEMMAPLSPDSYLATSRVRGGRNQSSEYRPDPRPIYRRYRHGITAETWEDARGEQSVAACRADSGRIWFAVLRNERPGGFELRLVDTLGGTIRSFEHQPDGWISRDPDRPGADLASFGSSLTRMQLDHDGNLRLLVFNPVTDALTRGDPMGFETVLEVIDPRDQTVRVSRITGEVPIGFAGDGFFATYREDAEGNRAVTVWEIDPR